MNAFDINVSAIFNDISTANPWENTPLERYCSVNAKSRGAKAEEIVKNILKSNGYDVKLATDTGHDCIINGVKTEIKFGLATKRNTDYKVIFNHIGFKKDWEQILFVCVNGDGEIVSALYSRDNFPYDAITRQQGGKSGGNDDFMINGTHSKAVLFNPTARRLF